jgi:spermidine synthase
MFKLLKKRIQTIESYLLGVKIQTYQSILNGKLELWLINNHKVLNSAHANQSFDSMHRIFQKVFRETAIENRTINNVLLLGLGCGSIPTILFEELHLNCSITAVDHDKMMLQIAKEHFDIQRFKKLTIIIDDALKYVDDCNSNFELIIVDLFYDDRVPEQFLETTFIEKVSSLLNSNGLLIFNMITQTKLQKEKFEELHKYFAHADVIKANGSNSIIVHQKQN